MTSNYIKQQSYELRILVMNKECLPYYFYYKYYYYGKSYYLKKDKSLLTMNSRNFTDRPHYYIMN